MATALAEDAAATSVDVAAYRLDHTDDQDDQGDRPISLTYVLEQDAKVILDTPAEDLVFIDPKATKDEVAAIFRLRHPPSHPALTNLVSEFSRYRADLPAKYCIRIYQEWYAGLNGQEVCEAAEVLGKPVRVVGGKAGWRADRQSLYAHGCYLRTSGDGLFVVYNPAIAARSLKRMAKQGDAVRGTPYVTCAEFMVWSRAMQGMNTVGGLLNIAGSEDLWNYRRSPVIHRLHRDLALFELLYGHGAYWQLEEFRTLIKVWKEKGPATWTAFERSRIYGYAKAYEDIFLLLDEEVDRKRKPRKRELKLRLPKGYRWK